MQDKRITLFAGHYGSGKTNIAVNYALHLKSLGKDVVIADLDIVISNEEKAGSLLCKRPYRCRLRESGVHHRNDRWKDNGQVLYPNVAPICIGKDANR